MYLIISSYIADLIFGDPEWLPHPVRGMGYLINTFDNRLNNRNDDVWIKRVKGMIMTFFVIGISGCLAYLFIKSIRGLSPFFGHIVCIYLGYITLSVRDLFVKAKTIFKKLEANSLVEARFELSKIVGRDTQNLSEEKIIKAVIESIAESTNDGIIAPLFYLILGGPVSAVVYKAINTLDSMVGYKNERYIHFGWFPAKLDDAVNFLPARITGLLISMSSLILRKNFKDSFKTMFKDGRNHPSPNSGISEASMAGALGIKLGGPSTYQGKLSEKPYLGEDKLPTRSLLINDAMAISFVVSVLMMIVGVIVKWVI